MTGVVSPGIDLAVDAEANGVVLTRRDSGIIDGAVIVGRIAAPACDGAIQLQPKTKANAVWGGVITAGGNGLNAGQSAYRICLTGTILPPTENGSGGLGGDGQCQRSQNSN